LAASDGFGYLLQIERRSANLSLPLKRAKTGFEGSLKCRI
jgi:hypothetical protein